MKGEIDMDIIHQIASITKAVVDAGDHELYQKLQDINIKAYELQMENIELREKITKMEEKERQYAVRIFRDNAYYFDGDGPFCTKCYDDENKKIRMHERDNETGTVYIECPKCEFSSILRKYEYHIPL